MRTASCGRDQLGQLGQRRGVAEDGVDRLRQHQRPALAAVRERAGDGGDVVVRVTVTVARVSRQASIIEAWICASETMSVSASASAWTTERFA